MNVFALSEAKCHSGLDPESILSGQSAKSDYSSPNNNAQMIDAALLSCILNLALGKRNADNEKTNTHYVIRNGLVYLEFIICEG